MLLTGKHYRELYRRLVDRALRAGITGETPTRTVTEDPARWGKTFVLLGASNLARGHLALTQRVLQTLHPQSVKFLFALGPGRGYRASGGIFYHYYPSIETCGILPRTREIAKEGGQLVALITDIGNDIMCGVTGNELIACLDSIFQSLQEMNVSIFVTPISSWLEKELGPAGFLFLRTVFYPKSRITHGQILASISKINIYLKEKSRISLITGLEAFAGWDKIHYGFFGSRFAWTRIADALLSSTGDKIVRPIQYSTMMASYQNHFRQVVFNDLLPLGARGPNYF